MKRSIFLLALATSLAYGTLTFADNGPVPSSQSCERLLAPKGTFRYYIERQTELRSNGKVGVQPRFRDPLEEMEIAKTWTGEEGPAGLMAMLPEGVTFIDHMLKDSDGAGLVKNFGAGVFMSLRAKVNFNDQEIGTNVGVNSMAVAQYFGSSKKYFVRPNARAALIALHGGGTKSAGHQTVSQLMNHLDSYGVDAISLDLNWHGEGPRAYFKDDNEDFEFLLAFIKKFVPDDVPVFIYGHSMGAQFADMIMRKTDDPTFALGQRVSGFIIAAPVADLMPGASLREKIQADRRVQQSLKMEENLHRIAPADLNISRQMAIDDKGSPVGSAYASFMGLFLDWTMPAHKGAKYKPAVVIVGNGDGLVYVGNEEAFARGYGELENVRFIVQSHREHIQTGVVEELIPHVNMDYRKPKEGGSKKDDSSEIEIFQEMRDLIARVSGEEVTPISTKGKDPHLVNARWLQLYANQLGAREFVKEYVHQERVPLPKIKELDQEYETLKKKFSSHPYVVAVNKIRKNARKFTPQQIAEQIAAIPASEGSAEAKQASERMEDIFNMRSLRYVPNDGNAEWATKNIQSRADLAQEAQAISAERQELKKEIQKLGHRRNKLEGEIADLLEKAEPSEALRQAYETAETQLLAQMEKDEKMQERLTEFQIGLLEKGTTSAEDQANYPQDLKDLINEYVILAETYQKTRASLYVLEREEALNGHLGVDLQKAYSELYGLSYLRDGEPAANSLNGQIKATAARMTELEALALDNKARQFELEEEYINKIVPDIFSVERIPLAEALQHPQKYQRVLEKSFSVWWDMYSNRSPDDDFGTRR